MSNRTVFLRCKVYLLVLLFVSVGKYGYAQNLNLPFGVNLCGAEFGFNHLPGKFGVDFIYPQEPSLDYFAKKGLKLISLPFRWERIQPQLNKPLDAKELGRMLHFIDLCNARGLKVVLSMQNFGRYSKNGVEYIIGCTTVTRDHFKDVWYRIADALKNKNNRFGYDIMNEPHDMLSSCPWPILAQDAINAIREVDTHATLLINGDSYANSEKWALVNENLKDLFDPNDKIIYEAHCFFDKDYSGTYVASCGDYLQVYEECEATEFRGVDLVKPFVDWLDKYHKVGFIGEYGIPDKDPRWLKVLDNFLAYISSRNINGTYWAAGPWWHDYPLAVEPIKGKDRPQMKVLERYKFVR